ncbi:tRNA (cytidine(34)-2'-O)-methyltransferase [Gleimia hominis]|uniref:Putative tRNA (cytidine(34)-2'-O)-methyltransferase n=1 Tax=Gleimia hominis TaxID=595468 RepID=A0ABU3IB08_9ACTO|nr:tRNA (cytidine(34)-2'-O)-methyltransferase [Gleimia hominis]MDT3767569.1 tRNA (cytidine(34)-2'-O)-methyltransferase [Gleimia hominis]
MLNVIFFEPRIPGNSGAAIRLSACTGSMLYLVDPLFDMDDTKLKRAGLDYHDLAHVKTCQTLDEALEHIDGNVYAFTGHTNTHYTDVQYHDGDALLFGPEPTGLPQWVMEDPRITSLVRIQMHPKARSLNLANSASIGLYEAWRQIGFPGGV